MQYATILIMKKLTNSKGSSWITTLLVIAIIVVVILIITGTDLFKSQSLQGLVTSVNEDGQYLSLSVTDFTEDNEGNVSLNETEYIVVWSNDLRIAPHHPELLEGGEIVKVVPQNKLVEDQTMFFPRSLEILQGAPFE